MTWGGFVPGACPEVIEREPELAFLDAVVAGVPTTGARLVLITGEAGAGKTRLAAELVARLPAGWRTVAITPELGGAGAAGTPAEPAAGLAAAFLAGLGPTTEIPVVAVAEDLHGVDPVTIAALGRMLDVADTAPLLVVATFRLGTHSPGDAHSRAVVDLLRRPAATELRLAPLTREGITAMAAAMRGEAVTVDDTYLSALHERTGGNPFFAEELLRSGTGDVPWTVAETVAARLEAIGGPARDAVAALAIAGVALPPVVLADAAGCDEDDMQPLVNAGMVVADGSRLRLRHALVGEAAVTGLAPGEARATHLRVAAALAGWRAAPPDRVARAWHAGGRIDEAVAWAARAASTFVARRAYRSAAEMYEIALEDVNEPSTEAEGDQFEQAAVAAAIAGDADRARRWAAQAERAFRADGVAWRAASMWLNPALHYLPKPPIDVADLESASAWRLVMEADDLTGRGDADAGAALAREALARARAEDDADARAAAAVALVHAGSVAEGDAELHAMCAVAAAAGDDIALANVLADRARVALATGHVRQAIEFDRRSLEAAQRDREAAVWPRVQLGLGLLLAICGELDEAERTITDLYALELPLLDVFLGIPLAIVDLETGDVESARQRLRAAMQFAQAASANIFLPAATVLAQVEFTAGNLDVCADTLAAARAKVPDVLVEETRTDRLLLGARVAFARQDAGDIAEAEAALGELARSVGGDGVRAAADAASALTALLAGDTERAEERFTAAARAWERAPRWVLAAEAWGDAAKLAAATGDAGRAAVAARRALEIALDRGLRRIESRPDLARLATGSSDAPAALAVLTERERDIVRLVADGATNREIGQKLFISEKTARNHLTAIFAKLGVRRRSEIAALVARSESD